MGADPNASIEPFAQLTGLPTVGMRTRPNRFSEATRRTEATRRSEALADAFRLSEDSRRPEVSRFSEASCFSDTSRFSGVSHHDAALPVRGAPPQPAQLPYHEPQHILLPSHSHEHSRSNGHHVSARKQRSGGAHSTGGLFHSRARQPMVGSSPYTYPTQPQQVYHPQHRASQPQGYRLQAQGKTPQEQHTQSPEYQSQTQQRRFIQLPRDIEVHVTMRRTYLVQVYPRRKVRFRLPRPSAVPEPRSVAPLSIGRPSGRSCAATTVALTRSGRSTAAALGAGTRAGVIIVGTLGAGTHAGMPAAARLDAGARAGMSSSPSYAAVRRSDERSLPSGRQLAAPTAPWVPKEACLEGKGL
jgi:hypothetical protein